MVALEGCSWCCQSPAVTHPEQGAPDPGPAVNSKAFLLRGAQTPAQPCPGGLSVSLLPKIRSHSLSCRGWCVTPPFCCPFSSKWGFFREEGDFLCGIFRCFGALMSLLKPQHFPVPLPCPLGRGIWVPPLWYKTFCTVQFLLLPVSLGTPSVQGGSALALFGICPLNPKLGGS